MVLISYTILSVEQRFTEAKRLKKVTSLRSTDETVTTKRNFERNVTTSHKLRLDSQNLPISQIAACFPRQSSNVVFSHCTLFCLTQINLPGRSWDESSEATPSIQIARFQTRKRPLLHVTCNEPHAQYVTHNKCATFCWPILAPLASGIKCK